MQRSHTEKCTSTTAFDWCNNKQHLKNCQPQNHRTYKLNCLFVFLAKANSNHRNFATLFKCMTELWKSVWQWYKVTHKADDTFSFCLWLYVFNPTAITVYRIYIKERHHFVLLWYNDIAATVQTSGDIRLTPAAQSVPVFLMLKTTLKPIVSCCTQTDTDAPLQSKLCYFAQKIAGQFP